MTDHRDFYRAPDNGPPPPISPSPGGAAAHGPKVYGSPENVGPASDHAYLILALGILSLTCCFPLGLVAWIMANRELGKIARGEKSPQNASVIQVGRALGIIGILITIIFAVSLSYLLQRDWLEDPWKTLSPKPLAPKHIAYIGHWEGSMGTIIDIHSNGRADYKTENSSVKGGVVQIEGETLSIGFFGIYKKWAIRQHPTLEDGGWVMQLNDEVFQKEDDGKLVLGRGGASLL